MSTKLHSTASASRQPESFSVSPQIAIALPLVLLLCAAACLTIDLAVARFMAETRFPGLVRELIQNSEPFGHGVGVILIILAAVILNPLYKRQYLQAGLVAYGAGLITNVVKFSFGRTRPRDLDLANLDWADTFTGWLPYLHGFSGSQSFPSGHTTTAFALAVALWALHARGKWLFLGLATLVGYGRVQSQAHFPSDVFAGAALGWSFAMLMIHKTNWLKLPQFETETESQPETSLPEISQKRAA